MAPAVSPPPGGSWGVCRNAGGAGDVARPGPLSTLGCPAGSRRGTGGLWGEAAEERGKLGEVGDAVGGGGERRRSLGRRWRSGRRGAGLLSRGMGKAAAGVSVWAAAASTRLPPGRLRYSRWGHRAAAVTARLGPLAGEPSVLGVCRQSLALSSAEKAARGPVAGLLRAEVKPGVKAVPLASRHSRGWPWALSPGLFCSSPLEAWRVCFRFQTLNPECHWRGTGVFGCCLQSLVSYYVYPKRRDWDPVILIFDFLLDYNISVTTSWKLREEHWGTGHDWILNGRSWHWGKEEGEEWHPGRGCTSCGCFTAARWVSICGCRASFLLYLQVRYLKVRYLK